MYRLNADSELRFNQMMLNVQVECRYESISLNRVESFDVRSDATYWSLSKDGSGLIADADLILRRVK